MTTYLGLHSNALARPVRIVTALLGVAMLLFSVDGMRSIDDDYVIGVRPKRASSFRSGKMKTTFTEAEASHISRQLAACEYGKKREVRLRGQVGVLQLMLSNQTVQCSTRVRSLQEALTQKEEAWSSAFAQKAKGCNCSSSMPASRSGEEVEKGAAEVVRLEGRIEALEKALRQKETELAKLRSAPDTTTEAAPAAVVPGPGTAATVPIIIEAQNASIGSVEERTRSRIEARKKLRREQ